MALRQAWRRVPRPARIGLWSLAAIVGLVIIGGGIFLATFDPDSLKPRIIAAVKQQTGRDLTLQGGIHLQLSLQPTLTVQGVSFANPPGFSRPQMATLERLDLTLALLPLLSHQVEIDRLVLVKPDILLETDAKGQPNWQFTKPGEAPPQPPASGEGGKTATRVTQRHPRREKPGSQRAVAGRQPARRRRCQLQRRAVHARGRYRPAEPIAGAEGRQRLAGTADDGGGGGETDG